jgi:hyperosmotically inducible protein
MKKNGGLLLLGTTFLGALTLLVSGCNKPEVAAGTKSPSAAVATEVSDIDVTTKVKTALLGDANLKSFDIAVVTLKGDVRLTGLVDNQSQIDDAKKVARGVDGVHSIHDELTIKK